MQPATTITTPANTRISVCLFTARQAAEAALDVGSGRGRDRSAAPHGQAGDAESDQRKR